MKRMAPIKVMAVTTTLLCCGCLSRMFAEGSGAVRGASGKSVDSGATQDFSKYRSLRVDPITVAQGLRTPAGMSDLIHSDLVRVADRRGLGRGDHPGLKLSGEIVHYEKGNKSDTVTGPLEEVIVRAVLTDAQTGNIVGETNLIGRSKASSSSGSRHLSDGVGEALDDWLENGGIGKHGDRSDRD